MKTTSIKTDEIEHEISGIIDFPDDRFEEIIREVGFVCDLCGRCCTREFNDHVFLLDDDAERIIEVAGREVLRPAPYYEFCDNLGRFYVMGYALRNKSNGDCIFYAMGRCDHYADRPEICRIFPYMLQREEDDEGNLDWRQIGGLNQHGLYHGEVGVEEARKTAGNVKRYGETFHIIINPEGNRRARCQKNATIAISGNLCPLPVNSVAGRSVITTVCLNPTTVPGL